MKWQRLNRKIIADSNSVLRKIFKDEENIDVLKNLIETILNVEIKEINLIKNLHYSLIYKEVKGIAEVKITTTDEEKILVGMQIMDGFYIQNKMVLYQAQLQLNEEVYKDVTKTVTINILDDEYFDVTDYKKQIQVKTVGAASSEKFGEIYLIQLKKFDGKNYDGKEKEWIEYLKEGIQEPKNEKIKKLDNLLDDYWKDEVL